jgi:hypothetical protein
MSFAMCEVSRISNEKSACGKVFSEGANLFRVPTPDSECNPSC